MKGKPVANWSIILSVVNLFCSYWLYVIVKKSIPTIDEVWSMVLISSFILASSSPIFVSLIIRTLKKYGGENGSEAKDEREAK